MDRTCSAPVWGVFLLAIGVAWALASAGVIPSDFWRYTGPAALIIVGLTMVWGARRRGGYSG